jgi:uncharacterized protein YjiS (DUF1127 family)
MTVFQNSVRLSPLAAFLSLVQTRIEEQSRRYQAWNKENKVRAELRSYTDRELADIGLSRYQVETMDLSENA